MSANNRLIIMAKRPEIGKSKTRLAADTSDEIALEVYHKLLNYTLEIADNEAWECHAFLTGEANWDCPFNSKEQIEGNLGERMADAFSKSFHDANPCVMIGTDCYDLEASTIKQSFKDLNYVDLVIGPSADGGYYLIGMKEYYPELLENMPWSQENLLFETLATAEKLKLSWKLLPQLNDIDTLEDVKSSPKGSLLLSSLSL